MDAHGSGLARWFAWLGQAIAQRPGRTVAVGLALGVAAGVAAVNGLGLATARLDLIGRDVPYVKRILDLESELGDLNSIVVVVRSRSPARARAFTDALAERIRADRKRFRGEFHRIDPGAFGPQALLYLPPERLAALDGAAAELLPSLGRGALPGALDGFAAFLEARLREGRPEAGGEASLAALAQGLLADTRRAFAGELPEGTPIDVIPGWDDAGYVRGADGTHVMLVAFNEEETGALDPKSAAVDALRGWLDAMAPRFPAVDAALTGKPVLDVDEMRTYQTDSARATIAALIGVTLLLVLAFRRLTGPLLVGACLALAVVITLGLATAWPGHLNLMAVVFVIVVIGLGVDFGIHFVARYDEVLAEGVAPGPALGQALATAGPAIVAGAATTAAAFASAALTTFQGLREFGVIAAFGVLASLAVMLTVLPALLRIVDRSGRRSSRPGRGFAWLDALHRDHPGKLLLGAAALTVVAAVCGRGVTYDGNLLRLQDPTLPSVQLEQSLLEDDRLSGWFLAYPAPDLTDLERAADVARAVPGVRRVESILDRLPASQQESLGPARRLQGRLATTAIPAAWPDERLPEALGRLGLALEDALDRVLAGADPATIELLEGLLLETEEALDAAQEGPWPAAVRQYDQRLRAALTARLEGLAAPPIEPLTVDTLPVALRDRLVGKRGTLLLRIFPEGDLWDPVARGGLLKRVRAVLPEVTGIPILLHESSASMAGGYVQAGGYAAVVVALLLLLHFRDLRAAGLAALALAIGGVWWLGAMGVLGIDLNPANLVALPLLLGVGIDTSVHVIHRLRESPPGVPLIGTSLGNALVFSGLTSAVSFGSLLLASHPGTASIGATIALGVGACLAAGLWVPPAIVAWRRRAASPSEDAARG